MSTQESKLESTVETFEEGASLWTDAWVRLKKNKLALIGLWVVSVLALLALFAPLLSPYGYATQNLENVLSPPSWQHWFGTDVLGRDLCTRVLYGGRVSLTVGIIATFVALVIGVLWGTIAGFVGGRTDAIMMRIVDALYALPFIIFIILLMVVFGKSILLLFLAIGAVEWLTMARIIRGQVLSLRHQEFIEATKALGLPNTQIIFKHILPNTLGPIIVYATLTVPQVMLLEAFLSFLGLGIQPPQSSWGVLISEGVQVMEDAPWLLIFPAIVLSLTLFSLNFLGDGLRDALDPKASKD